MPLTGPRFPNVTNNIKVTAYDDKPSPFVWVKGYRFASWPQEYPQDYALSYCINNPTQIVSERWDSIRNAMVPYQTDDFKYTYNENSYPEKIVQTTTYFSTIGTTTSNVITYNYTYKQ
ncbi:MAG: hypothetical protein EOP55_17750 [Sphingobacteriales bacterium]|nr:MAG: hypothetical protein EOP55_17750 [Sphingobacteriales bacterium]